jgi:hypothetical protein
MSSTTTPTSETNAGTQPFVTAEPKFPAFEDSEIKVLKGITLSKNGGWWSAILLVETYHKIQVKWYLWQEKENKDTHQKEWKRKQHFTINSYNWEECKKITDQLLAERKTVKPS